jgi:hypothetical protein
MKAQLDHGSGPSTILNLDRALNAAILNADVGSGYEEYLAIFDSFYADDLQASNDVFPGQIVGKAGIRSLLFNFLFPLHTMAEVGGLKVSIKEVHVPTDERDATCSEWTLELSGFTGACCTISWCSIRRWKDGGVVSERHFDHRQVGGPLGIADLHFGSGRLDEGLTKSS